MNLRAEIEPDIQFSEEIFPKVLKTIVDYNDFVYEKGDEQNIEYDKVIAYLSDLSGKDIAAADYAIWEYWEAEGEHRESFKIALPYPKKLEQVSKAELAEIVSRIKRLKIPDYLNNDFIKEHNFVWEIIDYYHHFLSLNFKNYSFNFFIRKKNKAGEWYEASVEEIVELIWK